MLKTGIKKVVILIGIIWIMAFTTLVYNISVAYASNTIIGNAADGYEAGKLAARTDHNAGSTRDAECPPGHGISWCVSYHVGYNTQWGAMVISD